MVRKLLFLLLLSMPIALIAPWAVAAELSWDDCIGCHEDPESAVKSPYIDPAVLEDSVHKNIQCRQCHSDIVEVEHSAGEMPHQRKPKKVNCTEQCHVKGNTIGAPDFSPMEQYKDSVHGVANRVGLPDAATCTDCHGWHNIRRKEDPLSTVYRANIPLTCAICHEDMQVVIRHHIHAEKPFQEYKQSVHGMALYTNGLIELAAVCIDCHGVHDIEAAGTPNLRPRRPETCGRCHIGIYDVYKDSIHGKAAIEDHNPDAPVCSDCHGEHSISVPPEGEIPSICSKCHSEEGLMSKYDIPVDRMATYEKSYHGIASGYGSNVAANCASCHGYHDIRSVTDPKSSIYPANLPTTCGKPKCHPGISPNVASAKMHVDVKKKEAGGGYYVRRLFIWIFVGLLIVTFIWLASDLFQRTRSKGGE